MPTSRRDKFSVIDPLKTQVEEEFIDSHCSIVACESTTFYSL